MRLPLAGPIAMVCIVTRHRAQHGTHINHRHFNIGYLTIPPTPIFPGTLPKPTLSSTSPTHFPLLCLKTGFYGEILLIRPLIHPSVLFILRSCRLSLPPVCFLSPRCIGSQTPISKFYLHHRVRHSCHDYIVCWSKISD